MGGELIFISEVLAGEPVGIAETETGEWIVRFANVELGCIDQNRRRLHRRRLPKPTKTALWTCGQRKRVAHNPTGPTTDDQRMIECQPCIRSNLSTIQPVAHNDRRAF